MSPRLVLVVLAQVVVSNCHTVESTTVATSFSYPYKVLLSSDETKAYVAEYSGSRVSEVIIATGAKTTLASGISGALSLAFSSNGLYLYVSEWIGGKLTQITVSSGATATIASGLSNPEGVTLAPDGLSVYVSEGISNGFISRIVLASGARTIVATGFNAPSDSVLSPDGTKLYVNEWYGNKITIVELSTGVTTTLIENVASFSSPWGMALSLDGLSLFSAQSASDKILKVTIATGAFSTYVEGLSRPNGLTMSSGGNLWCTETASGGRVKYFTTAGHPPPGTAPPPVSAGSTSPPPSTLPTAGHPPPGTAPPPVSAGSTSPPPSTLPTNPCFPASSVVTLANGTRIRVESLEEGDEILAASPDGDIILDSVSLFSLADHGVNASFITLRTADALLTLTPGHHLPVGPACCSQLKMAAEVSVGETVFVHVNGAALVAQTLLSKGLAIDRGLFSPLLTHGGFPIVDSVATSFNALGMVKLDSYALPYLLPLCKATQSCTLIRRALNAAECAYKKMLGDAACGPAHYIDGLMLRH